MPNVRRTKQKNGRYSKAGRRHAAELLLSCAALCLLLSGCEIDWMDNLQVLYDLTQQDQRDADGIFEYRDENGSFVILGPEKNTDEIGAAAGPDDTEAVDDGDPAPAEPEEVFEVAEEEIDTAPEETERAADDAQTRESIDRRDEEDRYAIGLTEDRITELIDENQGNYYFDHLDEQEKRLYAELFQIMTARGEKIRISTMEQSVLDRAFQYLMADHPEIFYVDGYTFTRYTVNGELYKLGFTARYVYDEAETSEREERIGEIVDEILAGAPGSEDQFYTTKYVFDYLVDHTDYVIGAPDNQNICSVFLTGRSVCQGYAKAAQLLLNRLSVSATLVTGTVSAGGRPPTRHAWNLARVNGNDYFLDVTWGDASFQRVTTDGLFSRRVNYDYLLDTTEDLRQTHSIDDLVEMPVCTELSDNYYVREGAYFTEVDEGQLHELFDRAYSEGRDMITLKCADQWVYDEIRQFLITDRRIFDYLYDTGSSVSYASSDSQRTLTFLL